MQPRDPRSPEQVMLWIALLMAIVFCFVFAMQSSGATCEEQCFVACIISTQEVCDACLDACVEPPRRIAPVGPYRQPGVDYLLPREVGFTVLRYQHPAFPGWLETLRDINDLGFHSAQLWIDIPPYCPGHWVEPYPSNHWVQDEFGCEAERLYTDTGVRAVFLKPEVVPWMVIEDQCYIMDRTPQAFILNRIYEAAWWRDITVVFTRWEQDWYPEGCPGSEPNLDQEARLEALIQYESRVQWQFQSARENMMRKYPNAKLTVLRAMVVNQFPGYNVEEGHPTVSEAIGRMVDDPNLYEPDLVGVSYWKRGLDPIPALDWVQASTKYPRSRIFIAEFGAREREQPDRYLEYIPLFWDWGIRTVLIWVHEEHWDGGRYGVTPAGLEALQALNDEAPRWGR